MTHAEIIAAVEAMTVLELADLVKAMEEKFGVSAAATAVVAGPAAAAAPVEEKTEFDVILKGFDAAAKLKVLKVIREVCGLGLKEAKVRRHSRVTTGISAFPLGWPWEAQSSPRVARESWGLRSSHCRAEKTSPRRVSGT